MVEGGSFTWRAVWPWLPVTGFRSSSHAPHHTLLEHPQDTGTCFPRVTIQVNNAKGAIPFMTQSPSEVTQHRFLHFVLMRSKSPRLALIHAEAVMLHLSKQEMFKDL